MMRMKYSGYMEGQWVSWKIDISASSWFNTEALLQSECLKSSFGVLLPAHDHNLWEVYAHCTCSYTKRKTA